MCNNEYKATRKTGNERFHFNGKKLKRDLLSFWQWSSSEILGNALRGVLAEYIVATATNCDSPIRWEWDSYDLLTPEGYKIEVKSSAYLQSWEQDNLSSISFSIQPTYGWDSETNSRGTVLRRQADAYIFCLLKHKEKSTVDPLDLDQWEFFVLSTETLDKMVPNQKTITLSSLKRIQPITCNYNGIDNAISEVCNKKKTTI